MKLHWSHILAITILLVVVAVQLKLSLKQNDNHFVYALDDPYIHMAIARNFARYGVWGVTRYEFSSSTSSPLWTLLLVPAYAITSSPYVPLILNVLCAVILLVIANFLLQQSLPSLWPRFSLLLALVFLVPLPALILSGMEHTAHITLSVLLVYSASYVIGDDQFSLHRRSSKVLLLLAAMAPLVRYESLFLVAAIVVLLGIRRRFGGALLVGMTAVIPLVVYGLISWQHGSLFLPNPVLLKGSLPRTGLLAFLLNAVFKILSGPHLLFLWLLAFLLVVSKLRDLTIWHREQVLSLIFILGTALHLMFAGIGWFYRYEAYLVALGIMIAGSATLQIFSQRGPAPPVRRRKLLPITFMLVLSVTTGALLLVRAARAIAQTIPATKNIYEQQYQMASFLQTYYSGASVAANDIGAINFMADIRCLDLWGLGSVEVTRAKLAGQYNTEKIAALAEAQKVRMALIYAESYKADGGVPRQWIKVGQWTIPDCVICGDPVVSFYAIDPNETERLKQNLREFSVRLPTEVTQAGLYHSDE